MKWPWVSRALHDEMLRRLEEVNRVTIAEMRALNERLFAANETALSRHHALRLIGGHEPAPIALRVPKEPDPLVTLINEKAGGDRGLRARMLNQLRQDRTFGKDDAEIQREIERGLSTVGIP